MNKISIIVGVVIVLIIGLAAGFFLTQKKQAIPGMIENPSAPATTTKVESSGIPSLDQECPAGQRRCNSFGITQCWELKLCEHKGF